MAHSHHTPAAAVVWACCLALTLAAATASCDTSRLGPIASSSGGYCFGVWAPNAGSAAIMPMGRGNWGKTNMNKNNSAGTFSVYIPGARPGDQYAFQFNGNLQRIDPRAQGIQENGFSYSVIPEPYEWRNSFTPPGPEKSVVYELHIPSFSGSNGGGTFSSAQAHLPYLQYLGVNMIELMPVGAFCGTSSGWGYNPCAPWAVMQSFGGPTGLKSFVDAANGMGIGVMLDVVWNHADGGTALKDYDGYAGSAGNGIYFYETSLNGETFWGPRPNFGSPEVAAYIVDSVDMWMNDYHISGFRWDSTICIRKPGQSCWTESSNLDAGWQLMQQANTAMLRNNGNAISAAEDTQGWVDVTLPVSDLNAGYPNAKGGGGFVSQWGYKGFFYSFFTQLTESDNGNVDMSTVATLASSSTEGRRVLFTENHDMASNQNHGRIPNIVDPNGNPSDPSYWAIKKSMLGIGVVMTAPGIPMLLQGQEFMTYADFQFPTPPNLDWSLPNTNRGIVSMVHDMISLRLNKNGTSAALTSQGANVIQVVDQSTAKVAVIHRQSGGSGTGSHVLVVLNMYNSKCAPFTITGVPQDGQYNVLFNGDLQRYTSKNQNCGASQSSVQVSNGAGSVMLPEFSMVILGLA